MLTFDVSKILNKKDKQSFLHALGTDLAINTEVTPTLCLNLLFLRNSQSQEPWLKECEKWARSVKTFSKLEQ